jgi:hypothetical protein
MISSLEQYFRQGSAHVATFNAFVVKERIAERIRADHVCYRCDSSTLYDHVRRLFEMESRFIYQSLLGGRRVAYISTLRSFETEAGPLRFLQLTDARPQHCDKAQFHHVEAYPTDGNYDLLISELGTRVNMTLDRRDHHVTHDVVLDGGLILRLTRWPFLERIKVDELK